MLDTLRKKITVSYILLSMILILVLGLVSLRAAEMAMFNQLRSQTFATLHAGTRLIEGMDEPNGCLSDVARELGRSTGGRVLVLSSLGKVLADSSDDESLLNHVISLDDLGAVLDGSSSSRIWRFDDTRRYLYAAVPIDSAGEVTGALVASLPLSEIQRVLARFVPEMFYGLAALLVLAVAISLLFGWYLGKPYSRLAAAFESAQMSDYSERLPVWGKSELARLSRAFNSMAERLNRTEQVRREFIVEASKELESPLDRMLSMCAEQERSAEDRLRDVSAEARKMATMVEELLDLARLEMKTDPLVFGQVDFCDVVDIATKKAHELASELGVKIKREDCVSGPLMLSGDGRRLVGALYGLLRAMVLLAPADEQIRLSLASDKKSILFSVSGVAPSLSEEDLPLIFERFLVRQTCGSTDSLPERSGAGLAFARRVIHLHGGFIEAKGGSGSSVTFFARLPRGASAE